VAREVDAQMAFAGYPYLAELTTDHILQLGYDFGDSFEFALGLIIDGLDRASRDQGGS
jgi:hypothetical protein